MAPAEMKVKVITHEHQVRQCVQRHARLLLRATAT
jgi:hypothetical protein